MPILDTYIKSNTMECGDVGPGPGGLSIPGAEVIWSHVSAQRTHRTPQSTDCQFVVDQDDEQVVTAKESMMNECNISELHSVKKIQ